MINSCSSFGIRCMVQYLHYRVFIFIHYKLANLFKTQGSRSVQNCIDYLPLLSSYDKLGLVPQYIADPDTLSVYLVLLVLVFVWRASIGGRCSRIRVHRSVQIQIQVGGVFYLYSFIYTLARMVNRALRYEAPITNIDLVD